MAQCRIFYRENGVENVWYIDACGFPCSPSDNEQSLRRHLTKWRPWAEFIRYEMQTGRPIGMLHLNLKGEYFDQIVDGAKQYEYRLRTAYWGKRLVGRSYDGIVIKRGYPKRGDTSKTIQRPWCGYELQMIGHPHFGPNRVEVFAIKVNPATSPCV